VDVAGDGEGGAGNAFRGTDSIYKKLVEEFGWYNPTDVFKGLDQNEFLAPISILRYNTLYTVVVPVAQYSGEGWSRERWFIPRCTHILNGSDCEQQASPGCGNLSFPERIFQIDY
jgi:hypothetical protein